MIEDQVAPKRCGHTKGKQVVGRAEARTQDPRRGRRARAGPDILIMARTDARAVNGFEDALERCHEFVEEGADIIFLEAPTSEDEMRRFCAEIERPTMANMIDGGRTPILPIDELGDIGYRLAAYPLALLSSAIAAMQRTLDALRPDARCRANRRADVRATPGCRGLPGLLGRRRALPHRLTASRRTPAPEEEGAPWSESASSAWARWALRWQRTSRAPASR